MALITEVTCLDTIKTDLIIIKDYLMARRIPFSVSMEIIRPANATAYAVSDIVNNNATPTVLPSLDFGVENANRKIQITGYKFLRNYGVDKWYYDFYFYNSNVLTGQNLADNQAFDPSFAQQKIKLENMLSWTSQDGEHWNGNNSGVVTHYPLIECYITLDANGKTYPAIITNAVFTPVSASIQDFTFFGYIL